MTKLLSIAIMSSSHGLEAVLGQAVEPEDVEGLFRDSVPPNLLHQITGTILRLTAEAHSKSSELACEPFNREIKPWLRRARINEELKAFEHTFPRATAQVIQTSGATWSVAIEIGDALILVARALSPRMMIPLSGYRVAIATKSLQGSLFSEEPPPGDAKLYAVVLYGGEQGGPIPSFIVVRFPTADHKTYLDAQVDLLKEYATASVDTTAVEQVKATNPVTLKPNAKKPAKESDSA